MGWINRVDGHFPAIYRRRKRLRRFKDDILVVMHCSWYRYLGRYQVVTMVGLG